MDMLHASEFEGGISLVVSKDIDQCKPRPHILYISKPDNYMESGFKIYATVGVFKSIEESVANLFEGLERGILEGLSFNSGRRYSLIFEGEDSIRYEKVVVDFGCPDQIGVIAIPSYHENRKTK